MIYISRHIFLEEKSTIIRVTQKICTPNFAAVISPMHGQQSIKFGVQVPKALIYDRHKLNLWSVD